MINGSNDAAAAAAASATASDPDNTTPNVNVATTTPSMTNTGRLWPAWNTGNSVIDSASTDNPLEPRPRHVDRDCPRELQSAPQPPPPPPPPTTTTTTTPLRRHKRAAPPKANQRERATGAAEPNSASAAANEKQKLSKVINSFGDRDFMIKMDNKDDDDVNKNSNSNDNRGDLEQAEAISRRASASAKLKCRVEKDLYLGFEEYRHYTCANCYNQVPPEYFKGKLELSRQDERVVRLSHPETDEVIWTNETDKIRATFKDEEKFDKWQICCRQAVECCFENAKHLPRTRSLRIGQLNDDPDRNECPGTWDGLGCWSPSSAGQLAWRECPRVAYLLDFEPACRGYVTKQCFSNASWFINRNGHEWSDYSTCSPEGLYKARMFHASVAYVCEALIVVPALLIIGKFPNRGGNKRIRTMKSLLLYILLNSLIQALQRGFLAAGYFAEYRGGPTRIEHHSSSRQQLQQSQQQQQQQSALLSSLTNKFALTPSASTTPGNSSSFHDDLILRTTTSMVSPSSSSSSSPPPPPVASSTGAKSADRYARSTGTGGGGAGANVYNDEEANAGDEDEEANKECEEEDELVARIFLTARTQPTARAFYERGGGSHNENNNSHRTPIDPVNEFAAAALGRPNHGDKVAQSQSNNNSSEFIDGGHPQQRLESRDEVTIRQISSRVQMQNADVQTARLATEALTKTTTTTSLAKVASTDNDRDNNNDDPYRVATVVTNRRLRRNSTSQQRFLPQFARARWKDSAWKAFFCWLLQMASRLVRLMSYAWMFTGGVYLCSALHFAPAEPPANFIKILFFLTNAFPNLIFFAYVTARTINEPSPLNIIIKAPYYWMVGNEDEVERLYATQKVCWFEESKSQGIEDIADLPNLILVASNVALFVITLVILCRINRPGSTRPDMSPCAYFKAAGTLLFLYGGHYFFLAYRPESESCSVDTFMFYAFICIDVVQGIAISIVFCYMTQEGKSVITKYWRNRDRFTPFRQCIWLSCFSDRNKLADNGYHHTPCNNSNRLNNSTRSNTSACNGHNENVTELVNINDTQISGHF